ncbi:MAG: glycosyltransferase family 9 protein [Candidatus Delongbacteria bacterium]|nr:glycosyltransferase family 9 protein [Candidatus Delongbacteria bacterium]
MKILILRFSSMGDILLATPVLDVLKEEFPESQIEWVVSKKYSDALNTNPLIDKLMVFKDSAGLKKIRKEIMRTDYDLIFDLHKNPKTRYLTRYCKNVFSYNKRVIDRFLLVCFKKKYKEIIPATRMYFAALEKAGIKTPAKWKLKFGMDKETELETVRSFDLHNINYIALIPGASYYTKMWPKEYFRELVRKITASKTEKRKIFILGKGSEEEMIGEYISDGNRSECVDLTGKLDLQQTAAVLKFADLVVTNDNGPMHLAECFDKKILAIFGCTTEEFGFFPYSVNYQVLQTDHLKCRPCTHFGRKKCPQKHFRCMMDISPDIVYEKICGMLNA